MRFQIIRASDQDGQKKPPCKRAIKDNDGRWYIGIETLEELIALYKEVDFNLIFDPETIWIYDYYME